MNGYASQDSYELRVELWNDRNALLGQQQELLDKEKSQFAKFEKEKTDALETELKDMKDFFGQLL